MSQTRALSADAQNTKAAEFRAAHDPSSPVVLCNVYDAPTASAIASLYPHKAKAMATASYAIAAIQGIEDDDMTMEQNLFLLRPIAKVALEKGIPLTVDIQDGYDDVKKTVKTVIELGAVGCNIEDEDNSKGGRMRDTDDMVTRVKAAVEAAEEMGVPNFAVNIRTDIMCFGGSVEDAIDRGKKYIAAGAYTVFVLAVSVPGGVGDVKLTIADVEKLSAGLNGMINLQPNHLRGGQLDMATLKTSGSVARISLGPYPHRKAMETFRKTAEELLE